VNSSRVRLSAFPEECRTSSWPALILCASLFDRNGGTAGASSHALTVGFIGTMVLAIGPRVLRAFCGMRVPFSSRLILLRWLF